MFSIVKNVDFSTIDAFKFQSIPLNFTKRFSTVLEVPVRHRESSCFTAMSDPFTHRCFWSTCQTSSWVGLASNRQSKWPSLQNKSSCLGMEIWTRLTATMVSEVLQVLLWHQERKGDAEAQLTPKAHKGRFTAPFASSIALCVRSPGSKEMNSVLMGIGLHCKNHAALANGQIATTQRVHLNGWPRNV